MFPAFQAILNLYYFRKRKEDGDQKIADEIMVRNKTKVNITTAPTAKVYDYSGGYNMINFLKTRQKK